jgi:hypothetical protein
MPVAKGIREVGFFDCAGGGQVVVENGYAYIGHISGPIGTTIVDVRDPSRPKFVASRNVLPGTHSHKVRVKGDIMLVNIEITDKAAAQEAGVRGGLGIYDISDRARPKEIHAWECDGSGVHRFTFDGRYAYISPEVDGYLGNIVMILDMADPASPKEVSRWWMPGQWIAGGETPTWGKTQHRCHHAIRRGDRLYVSYWHGGAVILDIEDITAPKLISHTDWSPPFHWPTHSMVPVPFTIHGHRWALVADEDVNPLTTDVSSRTMPAALWMVNISDETRPIPTASFQVEGLDGGDNEGKTGCHQPVETITGNEVPVAWFANGLRIIDISNPRSLREVAFFVPDAPRGHERPSSNDVYVDERGLIYLIDRFSGLNIVERT